MSFLQCSPLLQDRIYTIYTTLSAHTPFTHSTHTLANSMSLVHSCHTQRSTCTAQEAHRPFTRLAHVLHRHMHFTEAVALLHTCTAHMCAGGAWPGPTLSTPGLSGSRGHWDCLGSDSLCLGGASQVCLREQGPNAAASSSQASPLPSYSIQDSLDPGGSHLLEAGGGQAAPGGTSPTQDQPTAWRTLLIPSLPF